MATMKRHSPFLACVFLMFNMLMPLVGCAAPAAPKSTAGPTRPPNIVLILADDLGRGELGCYGQKVIKTPNIDALADRGMRFTNAYAGSCVCAPSRCTILTGLHTGHGAIRDNRELSPVGQEPLPESSTTIAQVLKQRGYATALIGKWGLGPPESVGNPDRHGFDHFFGYYCQRHAHNHCPAYLYRNRDRIELPGDKEKWERGEIVDATYAPDLMREEALQFITEHRQGPFFLMFSTPVPHAALQVPGDSLDEYKGKVPDQPYDGKKGYLPHETPHAAYAAMVSRLDRDVGMILARIKSLGLEETTLVLFTSDNGPTYNGGTDSQFFASAAGWRGLKGELYEGGIRTPLIAAWPGHVRQGQVSEVVTAGWDLFPTFAALAGCPTRPGGLDGVDLSPVLGGRPLAGERPPLYWEYASGGGWQAVRMGIFKGVRRQAKKSPSGAIELYDLSSDPGESTDIAASNPDVVEQVQRIMAQRTPSALAEWNFGP